jgi:hypothetical protein
MPLRTIARCLRGMAFMVGLVVARDLLAEGDVQFLGARRIVRVGALHAAVFEVADAELARQLVGGAVEQDARARRSRPRRHTRRTASRPANGRTGGS